MNITNILWKRNIKTSFPFVKWPHDVNGYLICQMRDKYSFVFNNKKICTLHVLSITIIIILFYCLLHPLKLINNWKEICKWYFIKFNVFEVLKNVVFDKLLNNKKNMFIIIFYFKGRHSHGVIYRPIDVVVLAYK